MISTDTTVLVKALAELAVEKQRILATAESCTGGLIAAALTEVSGSSAWFDRGFVTYSNEAKQEMLGVDPKILSAYGAVSRETVIAMAEGAIASSDANVAVSVSGVAGPAGGSKEKPVGTVWISCAGEGFTTVAEHHLFPGGRQDVRRQAVDRSVQLLITCIEFDS